MAMNWYYGTADKPQGPFDDAHIREMIRQGQIDGATLVWNEKMVDWEKAAATELARHLGATPAGGDAPGQCCVCQKTFPAGDLIVLDSNPVCAECKPFLIRKLEEGQSVVKQYRYAGFWIRFAAKIIDGIILGIISLPLNILAGFMPVLMGDKNGAISIFLVVWLLSTALGILIACSYNGLLLWKKGATLGKMACGIKVINADGSDGISLGKGVGRYFAEMLSGVIIYIGYLMVAFDGEKRALHDRICNTRVVYK